MLPEDIKDAIEEALTYGENKRQLATRVANFSYQRGREDKRKETMDCLREMAKNASEDYDLTEQGIVEDIIERIEARRKDAP